MRNTPHSLRTSPLRSRRAFLRAGLAGTAGAMLARGVPVAFARSAAHVTSIERAIYTMGSVLHATVYAESRSHGIQALSLVFEEFRRLEKLLSVFDDASEISAVNRAAGLGAVNVSQETFDVVRSAVDYERATGGMFSPMVEPLMRVWGFRSPGCPPVELPSAGELTALVRTVSARNIALTAPGRSIGLTVAGSALDLGGIGVGFALDRAIGILRREGIEAAFLNHGGDAYALGHPPGSGGWEVGIPDPANPSSILESFMICDRAIATSGAYERYVEIDGTRFGHILDPNRGFPAVPHASVTVLAASSTHADALSTAIFCIDSRECAASLAGVSGIEAIIVDAGPNGSPEVWRC